MILSLSLLLITATVLLARTAVPGATSGVKKYTVNNAVGANGVEFISDAPMEKITGTADGLTGIINFDGSNVEATTGRIDVQVVSMKTANSKRDGHMYSQTWLDATAHPMVSFDVKSLKDVKIVSKDGRNVVTAKAVGTFTCRGVAKMSTADITLTFIPESAETKKRASGNLLMVETSFTVALSDHQIEGKGDMIGKSVGSVIAIKAKLFANS